MHRRFPRTCTYVPAVPSKGFSVSGKVKGHASKVRILSPFVFPAHRTKTNRDFPLFLLVLPPVGPHLLFSGDIAATRIIIQMLLDNSLGTSDRDISPVVNTPSLESRGSSPGESMLSSACSPMLPDDSPPAPAFIPRHFPPPALAGVPVDYIIHKLHQLAPKYWDKPDTADCTISKIISFTLLLLLMLVVVPIPHPVGVARRAPDMPIFTPELPFPGPSNKQDPGGFGRRASELVLSAVPRVSFKVRRSSLYTWSFILLMPVRLASRGLPVRPVHFLQRAFRRRKSS